MTDNMKINVRDILSRVLPNDDAVLAEVADKTGMLIPHLRAFRNGDWRVPLDRSFKIADALGIDRADFFSACLKQFLSDDDIEKFLHAFGRDRDPTCRC